jgi:hypothetical protein
MPVRIKSKTRTQDVIPIEYLNSEYQVGVPSQADDYIIEGQISLQNMQSGDTVIVRLYVSVDGVSKFKSDEWTFSGVQEIPVVRIPAVTLPYNGKFTIGIVQTSGTPRNIPYTLILQLMETI